ncbi:argininosuccinate lyase [Aerococcaceae bacterium WGS1372]
MAIWSNEYHQEMSQNAYQFNQSLHVDLRLLDADLRGSTAHAKMLGKQEIIDSDEAEQLILTLESMRLEHKQGKLVVDMDEEDIHSFIESELTRRVGYIGKKIHTGRSRNDQVATAMKLYAFDEVKYIKKQLKDVIIAFTNEAEKHLGVIMPSYTHLQRAQPITYAHYLMSYVEMFKRDYGRLNDAGQRILNTMPLGSGALATTTFPLDRQLTTDLLGFDHYALNSLDGVSDRDYSIELLSVFSILSMHLSRYAEEVILWTSQEFNFLTLQDTFSTGSSIMPQKKNADIHELFRGKTGRVYGDLVSVLTLMKGLPLAYNKDLQEEKERLFDGIDSIKGMLSLLPKMIEETMVNEKQMYQAATKGFINSTDCADYLVYKKMAFRDAYQVVGNIIQYCLDQDKTLEALSLEEYQQHSELFEEDIYEAISLKACVERRQVAGGPAPKKVKEHIAKVRKEFN